MGRPGGKIDGLKAKTQEWRDAGLCPSCGAEPAPGRKSCERHLLYFRRYHKERRRRIEASGDVCSSCRSRKPRPGMSQCAPCSESRRKTYARMYQKRKRTGICVTCGIHPARPERVKCSDCAHDDKLRKAGLPTGGFAA